MTKAELIKLLEVYPDNFEIINQYKCPITHIVNLDDRIVLSTHRPIGYCNRTGEYVYPSEIKGYSAFNPFSDEDLFDFEWTKIND